MQNKILLSFRKRLKNRGYNEISIYQNKLNPQNYIVRAREPLSNQFITCEYPLLKFNELMR